MSFPPPLLEGGMATVRCLDSSHNPACTACTPAPGEAELAGFQLHATAEQLAAAGRSAEKHLRSLLARTPEWASAQERERLAATAPPHLARALRKRLCSALRKADMVALCRAWGYRSNLWRPVPGAQPPPPGAHPPTWQLADVAWDHKQLAAEPAPSDSSGPDDVLLPRPVKSTHGRAAAPPAAAARQLSCRVPGCRSAMLTSAFDLRVRLCEEHKSSLEIALPGSDRPHRFCQKCARLHDVREFKGATRTCRKMLDRHNARRRLRAQRDASGGRAGGHASGGSGPAGGGDVPGSHSDDAGTGAGSGSGSGWSSVFDDADDEFDLAMLEELFQEDDDGGAGQRLAARLRQGVPLFPLLEPPSVAPHLPAPPASAFLGAKLALASPTQMPPGLASVVAHPYGGSLLGADGGVLPGCVHLLLHVVTDPTARIRGGAAAHALAVKALAGEFQGMVLGTGVEAAPQVECVPPGVPLATPPGQPVRLDAPCDSAWFHGSWVTTGAGTSAPQGGQVTLPALHAEGAVLLDHRWVVLLIADAQAAAEINAAPRTAQAAELLLALGMLLHDTPQPAALQPPAEACARLAQSVAAAALGLGWRHTALLALRRASAAADPAPRPRGSVLHEAVRLGDHQAAAQLLQLGCAPWAPDGSLLGSTPLHVAAETASLDGILAVLSTPEAAVSWVCVEDGQGATPSTTLRAALLRQQQHPQAAQLLALDRDLHHRVAAGKALLRAGRGAIQSTHGVFLPGHQAAALPAMLYAAVDRLAQRGSASAPVSHDAADVAAALLAAEARLPVPHQSWRHTHLLRARRLARLLASGDSVPEQAEFHRAQVASARREVMFHLVLPAVPNVMMLLMFPPWADLLPPAEQLKRPGAPQQYTMQLFASQGWYLLALFCNLAVLAVMRTPRATFQRLYTNYNGLLLGGVLAVRYIISNILTARGVCATFPDVPGVCPAHMPCHVIWMQLLFTLFAGVMYMRASVTCVVLGVRMLLPFLPAGWHLWFAVVCNGNNRLYLAVNTAASLCMMLNAVRRERVAWRAFQQRKLQPPKEHAN